MASTLSSTVMVSVFETKAQEMAEELHHLASLLQQLRHCHTLQAKIDLVRTLPRVKEFGAIDHPIHDFLTHTTLEEEYVIKSVIALGQGRHVLLSSPVLDAQEQTRLQELIRLLLWVEKFYAEIGGVIGYHVATLNLLHQHQRATGDSSHHNVVYQRPHGIDITSETSTVREAIVWGIDHLPEMAEIYPVGGAADRLRLQDEQTGIELPAARLFFCGRTLLEAMVRDVQAREYLHYKLKGFQCVVPIAMMTSYEKENHAQILAICEEKKWFGRSKDSFHFFCQPLVPTMNEDGQWCLQGPLQLLLKPGGHGVIWKLARDVGVLDWFSFLGKKKALLRQINNPIASTDYGLLAFGGIGSHYDKAFGFASCPRYVSAAEGVNVLAQQQTVRGIEHFLTNIEYCDFKKKQISDEPACADTPYSQFPSNTNILFADLKTVTQTVEAFPIPGLLVNLKKAHYRNASGQIEEQKMVRLESTMQNIADYLGAVATSSHQETEVCEEQLKAFLTYNRRCKTISAIKREFVPGSPSFETPEGCFLDVLKNAYELLKDYCGMELPMPEEATHTAPFLFLYHPALGPLYRVIAQKIRGGRLERGSELQLEIAEVALLNLDLRGSLLIQADSVMGHVDHQGVVCYSSQAGKCVLNNVRVYNQGIDLSLHQLLWKQGIIRKECCRILIQGSGEFHAENVTLFGNQVIEVADGERVIAKEENGQLILHRERLTAPTWQWTYTISPDHHILVN